MGRKGMREEIVEAAMAQFHTHGFNAAGVKDITDRAGVPKGSFYNHFDSKEALAVVALERYGAGRGLPDLTRADADPLARLRNHFEFLRGEIVAFGFRRGCLIGDFGTEIADHSEVIREAVRAAFQAWDDALAATIAEAQRAGQVSESLDPAVLAVFLLNAWEGTLISVRAQRSADAFDAFFTLVFGSLLT